MINKTSKRSWFILGILITVFVGPIIAAWSLYSSQMFSPSALNRGQLLTPPLLLNNLSLAQESGDKFNSNSLKGKWVILYIDPSQCDQQCLNILYYMRQIVIAMGPNQQRVDRVIITVNGTPQTKLPDMIKQFYPGTLHLIANKKQLSQFLYSKPTLSQTEELGNVYIVDPLGNIMMYYRQDQKPQDIFNDLKRLLTVSRIG